MRKSQKIIAIMGFVWTCAAVGAWAGEAPTSGTAPQASIDYLNTVLFTDKGQYVLGEPVFLRLVFANWSRDVSYNLQGYMHPANDLEIRVARARELPRRYTGSLKKEALVPAMNVDLRPRQIHALRVSLGYEPANKSGFLFDQPGIYTISCRARMTVNQVPKDLVLPDIQMVVVAPTEEQQKALDLVMNPGCASDIQNVQARKETEKTWQDVAERFPKSPWAPYARMFLARQALENSTSDLAKVLEQLQAIARDYPNFYLLDDIYYMCATAQDRMARPREALSWLYRIQRECPDSAYIQPISRLFHKYIYPDGWERRYAAGYLRE